MHFLLKSVLKSREDISGISRRSITREVEKLYDEQKELKKLDVQNYIHALKKLCKRPDMLCSVSHDIWSSKASKSYVGLNLHITDVTSKPWKMKIITLACTHHPSPHTSVNNLERAEQVFSDWDLDSSILLGATQDTIGNSINGQH